MKILLTGASGQLGQELYQERPAMGVRGVLGDELTHLLQCALELAGTNPGLGARETK